MSVVVGSVYVMTYGYMQKDKAMVCVFVPLRVSSRGFDMWDIFILADDEYPEDVGGVSVLEEEMILEGCMRMT